MVSKNLFSSVIILEVKIVSASEAHMRATRKWEAKAYDRVALNVPKGQRQIIKDFASAHGYSTNAFILEAVTEKMQRMEQQK